MLLCAAIYNTWCCCNGHQKGLSNGKYHSQCQSGGELGVESTTATATTIATTTTAAG